mgnify:CR=1 FL=1
MSVRAEGSNAPLRRDEKKKIKRIKKRTEQLMSEGKTKEEAEKLARNEEFDDLR